MYWFWVKISKVIQMLVRWHKDGPHHPAFKLHQDRVRDYLWQVVQFICCLYFAVVKNQRNIKLHKLLFLPLQNSNFTIVVVRYTIHHRLHIGEVGILYWWKEYFLYWWKKYFCFLFNESCFQISSYSVNEVVVFKPSHCENLANLAKNACLLTPFTTRKPR